MPGAVGCGSPRSARKKRCGANACRVADGFVPAAPAVVPAGIGASTAMWVCTTSVFTPTTFTTSLTRTTCSTWRPSAASVCVRTTSLAVESAAVRGAQREAASGSVRRTRASGGSRRVARADRGRRRAPRADAGSDSTQAKDPPRGRVFADVEVCVGGLEQVTVLDAVPLVTQVVLWCAVVRVVQLALGAAFQRVAMHRQRRGVDRREGDGLAGWEQRRGCESDKSGGEGASDGGHDFVLSLGG